MMNSSDIPKSRLPMIAAMGVFVVLPLAGALVTTSLQASRTVVSDMDCVVEPSLVVDLGSAAPGLIANTLFDRSDFVSKGTVMARLESGVEEATLAIAAEKATHVTGIDLRKKTAEFGDRNRMRNVKLANTDVISSQELDQVSTEAAVAHLQVRQEEESHQLAQLELRQAEALLARRSIVSPIDGAVIERYKTSGEYVDNDPVYRIAQLNPLHIEVIVPIDLLGSIETGMTGGVIVNAPGFENDSVEAVVRRIDAVGDAASGTYGVRLELDNPDMVIPSGVRCQVSFFAS